MGVALDQIGPAWLKAIQKSDCAGARDIRRLPGGGDHRRCAHSAGRRFGRAPRPSRRPASTLRRTYSHDLHNQGSRTGIRNMAPNRGALRRPTGWACAWPQGWEARAVISMAEYQKRGDDADCHCDRLRAGDLFHRATKARHRFRRDGRRGRLLGEPI